MTSARTLPIEDVRPTQLYLSAKKLRRVLEWFDFDEPNHGSLPAFEHDGRWYLSDGHTRAFAAYLAGAETLRIERDREIREAYDFGLYLECVDWCRDADVESVADLRGRVLEPETYEAQWLERCRRARSRPED